MDGRYNSFLILVLHPLIEKRALVLASSHACKQQHALHTIPTAKAAKSRYLACLHPSTIAYSIPPSPSTMPIILLLLLHSVNVLALCTPQPPPSTSSSSHAASLLSCTRHITRFTTTNYPILSTSCIATLLLRPLFSTTS